MTGSIIRKPIGLSAEKQAGSNRDIRRYLLSLGHLCSDINQGTLSALLPFLIAAYHYDYTTAATLVMVSNIIGSIIQPIFGIIADKKPRILYMVLGVFMAGGGMAMTGYTKNFGLLCLAVMISGTGIAMFHPSAGRFVNRISNAGNKGANLGIFAVGGNLGFTLGPILVSLFVSSFGLKGTLVFLVPSFTFAIITKFFFSKDDLEQPAVPVSGTGDTGALDRWASFIKLSVIVAMRSVVYSGINTFLILRLAAVYGLSESIGSIFLSVYYVIHVLTSLIGGKLSDSLGYRKCVRLSFLILLPALLLFSLSGSLILSLCLLLPMGIGISLCYSPMMVLGQQYLPNRVGLASGVTLGLAVSIGGIFAPLLGRIGDVYGLNMVFYCLCGVIVIPLVLSFFLE